jgi:orotidine-5'-phosphate decarboxylase
VSFEARIRKASEQNNSRVVLALDLEGPDVSRLASESEEVLRKASQYICAVKINRQLVLALGLRNGVDRLVGVARESSLPTIMDAKLNDVGHTNEFMMRSYLETGFDAIIASPIVGWENGLDSVFRLANAKGKSVILLTYMSNPGAEEFYSLMVNPNQGKARPMFELLAEKAVEWKAHGAIVAATKPHIITRVRELVGPTVRIYSPGVGAQGGDARRALDAGADFLIVGRSIYGSPDPAKAAMEIRDAIAAK